MINRPEHEPLVQRLHALREQEFGTLKKGLFTPDNIHLTQDGGYEQYARKLQPLVTAILGDWPLRFPARAGTAGTRRGSRSYDGLNLSVDMIVHVNDNAAMISKPFFAICVKEVEAALARRRYELFVLNTDEDAAQELSAVRAALGRNVDGVVICPACQGNDALNLLQRHGKPFLVLGRPLPRLKADVVAWDNRRGGYLATEHLLQLGRRRILHLAGPSWISDAIERRRGYRDALQRFGVRPDPRLEAEVVINAGPRCYENVWRILEEAPAFDAIFAFSDLVAWTAMARLAELGRSVPRDVAVAGFDDVQSYLPFPCALTSIGVPMRQQAERVVEVLLARIEGDRTSPPRREILEPRLIVRGSTVAEAGRGPAS